MRSPPRQNLETEYTQRRVGDTGRGSRVAKENDRGAIQTPRIAQNKKNF